MRSRRSWKNSALPSAARSAVLLRIPPPLLHRAGQYYPLLAAISEEFINPFLASAVDVFRTMLGCELVRGPLGKKNGSAPEHEVSGLIGLSGKCQGMVVVSLGRETALSVTETLLGQRPESLNADVADGDLRQAPRHCLPLEVDTSRPALRL